MSRLYALTRRTADALRAKLGEPIHKGRGFRSSPAARGVTWVKVTGAASGGWHPGLVSLDQAGAFEDLTAAVELKSSDGGELVTGARYLCTRTADKADGTARFRASAWSYFLRQNPSGDYATSADAFADVTGASITAPAAGRYRIDLYMIFTARAATLPVGACRGRVRVNTTDYASLFPLQVQAVTTIDLIGSAGYSLTLNLASGDVVKMQAGRDTASGSWTTVPTVSSSSFLQLTRV